jgi:hypothetical protein
MLVCWYELLRIQISREKTPLKYTRHNTPRDTKSGASKPIPKKKKYNTHTLLHQDSRRTKTQQLHLKK